MVHVENTQRRKSAEAELRHRVANLERELSEAQSQLRSKVSEAAAAREEMVRADCAAEELRYNRAKEARSKVSAAEDRAVAARKEAADRVLAERGKLEREMRGAMLKIAHLERQIAGKEFVERSVHEGMQHRSDYRLAAVQKQLDVTAELLRVHRERERERERAEAEAEEEEQPPDGPIK